MTADDARKLVVESGKAHGAETKRQALIWFECWSALITKTAKSGNTWAHEEDIDQPRTPIGIDARNLALDMLVGAGFTVYRDERKVLW